jgi:hypothetical protein
MQSVQTLIDQLKAAAKSAVPMTLGPRHAPRTGFLLGRAGEIEALPSADDIAWASAATIEAAAESVYALVQRLEDVDEHVVLGADTHPNAVMKLAALAGYMRSAIPTLAEAERRLRAVDQGLGLGEPVSDAIARELLIASAEIVRKAVAMKM